MKKNTLDINELINGIKNGDRKCRERVYKIFRKTVFSFLIKKYPNNKDIDDDTSEIMIKIFERIEKYDSEKSKFNTWVINIANHHMIDKWKKNKLDMQNFDDLGILTMNISNHTMNSAIDNLNYDSTLNQLSNKIDEQCMDMVQMKYSGYSYNEIAVKFNVTASQVSNKLNYIKKKMKVQYKK